MAASPTSPATPSISKRAYAWTRFWAPLGSAVAYFDGFLTDPEDELGARLNPNVRAWAAIADQPCLVLLGEPGVRKSTEVERAARVRHESGRTKHVDLSLYSSEDRLLRDVFEDGTVSRWAGDGAPFELFFDALDESLFHVGTFVKNLIARLRDLPRDRTRVRIACRTADWPNTLEAALRALYPGDAFSICELLPLRRKDCVEAARANGFDTPEDFVRDVTTRDLQSLAIKPLTLDLLLRTSSRGALPESRQDLFERATLLLATDPNDVYPKAAQSLSPAQRLAVAQRIAAATILCGKNVIARDGSSADSSELVLEQIAGGTERVGEATLDIDAAALAETVRTGLFSGAGPSRLGWYHHAIAEFLAARWLVGAALDPRQVDALLFHPEDTRRVVPQLRSVASWVAAYDSRVLLRLGENEPALLLGTDAPLSEASRAGLVDALLRRVNALEAHDFDYALRARYATLKHSGLAAQLGPLIRDRAKNPMVRRVAIDIAEECGVNDLEELLVGVALDAADTYGTRQQAVAAFRRIGSAAARRRLRPLVTATLPEDVDDELRGNALHALWPDHITRTELFAALRTPRAPLYYGAYASFVMSLASRLRDEDITDALDWAVSRVPDSLIHSDKKTVQEIVARALHLLSDPAVARAYARFVASSLRNHHSEPPAGWDRILSEPTDPAVRRALLLDVFALVGTDWIPSKWRLFGPNDFAWLLSQLEAVTAPATRQVIIDAVVRIVQFGVDVDELDAVLSAAVHHGDLATGLDGFTRAIDIDSETAAAQRNQQKKMVEMMKRLERPHLDPPPAERVRRVLEQIDAGDTAAFWLLFRELTLKPDSTHYDNLKTRITTFPGWEEADEPTRSRVVSAAKRYLVECDPERDVWFGKSMIHYPALAGYGALRLLFELEPDALGSLTSETWAKWAPIIVASRTLGNDRDPAGVDLLKRAYGRAPDMVIEVVGNLIRDEDRRHKMLFILSSVEEICDGRVLHWLTRILAAPPSLHPESTAQILVVLLRHAAPGSVALARRLIVRARIEGRVAASKIRRSRKNSGRTTWRRRSRACSSARERLQKLMEVFLSESPASAWPMVTQLMTKDRVFCRCLFQEFAYRHDHHGHSPSRSLPEGAVAALYLWLRREFPPSEDLVIRSGHVVDKREAVGHLRDRILDDLKQRKTFAARDAIRELARASGDPSLLVHAIDVETLALAETWAPPTPSLLVRLLRDREARVVTSGAHLLDVVLESLRRLQTRLQGEIPEVPFLWDGGGKEFLRPKDEESLSSFVAAHLDRDLRERGIIINREVQVRRRRGARAGENTDIHIDTVTTSTRGPERLRLIVESKGNWNQHLETDLEDQLANRYLAENEARHGIYLVGWYRSTNWDPSDPRKAAAERRDRSVVAQLLADKAKTLSQAGTLIEVCVLDTRM